MATDVCLKKDSPHCAVVPEAMHEASRGPEKGAVSAQKALRGFETDMRELLVGTEENSFSATGAIALPSRQPLNIELHAPSLLPTDAMCVEVLVPEFLKATQL